MPGSSNNGPERRTRATRERDHAQQTANIAKYVAKLPGIGERAAQLNAERAAGKAQPSS